MLDNRLTVVIVFIINFSLNHYSNAQFRDFNEYILIKNGTVVEHIITQLNTTNTTLADDDDKTTAFTIDDEDRTANITTPEEPDPTQPARTPPPDKTLPFPPASEPEKNILQRILRAILNPTGIVLGPLNLDLTGQSLFQFPLVREAFGVSGPLGFLNPFLKETATTPAP